MPASMMCVKHSQTYRWYVTAWRVLPKPVVQLDREWTIGDLRRRFVVSSKILAFGWYCGDLRGRLAAAVVRVKKPDLIFLKYLLSCTEIECPGDLVYDSCATACPATCLNPEGSQDCQKPCIEACSCPEGLVREGDRCINASQCGCYLDRGLYLPVSPVQSKCLGIDLGENCLACAVVRNVGKESKDFGRNAGRLISSPLKWMESFPASLKTALSLVVC